MLRAMTWRQFLAWAAYSYLEPFGEDRADLRTGILASLIANVNRDRKRQPRPFEPADFVPEFGEKRSKVKSHQPMTREQWQQYKDSWKRLATSRQPIL